MTVPAGNGSGVGRNTPAITEFYVKGGFSGAVHQ
jgi:hypothetical protein